MTANNIIKTKNKIGCRSYGKNKLASNSTNIPKHKDRPISDPNVPRLLKLF